MKKALSILFAMLIALSCLSAAGVTAFADDELTYGNLKYEINDGKVTITGVTDTNITEAAIPSKIDGNPVTSIGNGAFSECENLASITISDSVTSIGNSAFYNTAYYNNDDNWENDVLYIGNHLIAAKNTISGEYTIKSGTKTIGYAAFHKCMNLTSITIPDSVTSIGYAAFYYCAGLTNVTIGSSVTSIDNFAFWGCTGLKSIIIPDSVKTIGDGAFQSCIGLTSVTIGNGVTSIGMQAFSFCEKLTSITISDSVKTIGGYAFDECNNLKDIYYSGTKESWNAINIASNNDLLTTAKFEDTNGEFVWIHLESKESAAPTVKIAEMSKFNDKTVDYKTTITFHAEVENAEAKDVVWYVNGKKAGTGESYTVSQATADYEIHCEVAGSDGNKAESESVTVHVNASFIAKLIAFFRSLFGLLPVFDQK